jgi:F-type H+-transporting ATPase subunit delta
MKVTASQYANTLYELTDGKSKQDVGSVVAGFLKVLQKNNQLKMAGKIIEKFSNLYNQKNGIVEAEIATARKLESSQVHKVESYVKEKYKAKEVVIKNKIDESIKGGIVIKVGDEILDASVANKLKKLESILSK